MKKTKLFYLYCILYTSIPPLFRYYKLIILENIEFPQQMLKYTRVIRNQDTTTNIVLNIFRIMCILMSFLSFFAYKSLTVSSVFHIFVFFFVFFIFYKLCLKGIVKLYDFVLFCLYKRRYKNILIFTINFYSMLCLHNVARRGQNENG